MVELIAGSVEDGNKSRLPCLALRLRQRYRDSWAVIFNAW